MDLPKLPPEELVEELETLARHAFVETFPHVKQEDTVEADAAHFVRTASELLQVIADDGGPYADRAQAVLDRKV